MKLADGTQQGANLMHQLRSKYFGSDAGDHCLAFEAAILLSENVGPNPAALKQTERHHQQENQPDQCNPDAKRLQMVQAANS